VKTSEVLRKAGDVLRERGWCQNQTEDGAGRVCAIGALGIAEADNASCASGAIYRALQRVTHDGLIYDYLIGDWNDRPGRTAAEVEAALDAAYVLALQEEGIEPEDVL
jgi:hypothetical protein